MDRIRPVACPNWNFVSLFGFLLGLSFVSPLTCHSCPDLAYPAVKIESPDAADLASIQVNVSADPMDNTESRNFPLDALYGLKAGHYRFLFFAGGKQVGVLENVCTAGRIKGCEAEWLGEDAVPQIEIKRLDDARWRFRLTRNGRCPTAQ